MQKAQTRSTDVRNAKRYRIEDDKMRNIYITIVDDDIDRTPLELWVTLPDENKPEEQVLKTDIVTIAALFSEARQGGVPYTKLIRSMESTCYSKQSIPARLLNLLKVHCSVEKAEALEFEFASGEQNV